MQIMSLQKIFIKKKEIIILNLIIKNKEKLKILTG